MPVDLDALPAYTGLVAERCKDPKVDAARVYAAQMVDAGLDVGRPAKPCRECRHLLGRMRADARLLAGRRGEDLALALRSADCHIVGVL